ncbi:MAG: hypothetical protein HY535_07780 [Chloroflexi bacterium]|nr:hypothetical protein [Chloroflexota bacterium]
MRNHRWVLLLSLLAIAASSLLLLGAAAGNGGSGDLERARAAQQRHTDGLLANPDVAGTAVGYTEAGEPAVLVFTSRAGVGGIPASLDGVPVAVHVTGAFSALNSAPPGAAAARAAGAKVNRKARFDPVPIGVSTGNELSCSAGTIGARVLKGATGYALSNNHVYAEENDGVRGVTKVYQPGLYDSGCVKKTENELGALTDYVDIVFSDTANNEVDAAIAEPTSRTLLNSTPDDGYGTPRSATAAPYVGLKVQKYGRTSGLTKGQVVGVDATVKVGYGSGVARFVHQIVILGNKPFLRSGDSGSLVVTSTAQGSISDKTSVGLAFAASSNGYAIANEIDRVLSALGIAIDGA